MSAKILNIALCIIVNLTIWLVGASLLFYPETGYLFWMLIALGFALLGGLLSQPLASRLSRSSHPPGTLASIILGAMPLLTAFGYFQLVRADGQGLLLWLLYGGALFALAAGTWFTWRLLRPEVGRV